MYIINKDINEGFISIGETFSISPTFSNVNDIFILSIVDLSDMDKFKSFDYNTTGTNKSRFLDTYYRISRDTNSWTEWLSLDDNITNFPPFDHKDTMYIDIKWERSGNSTTGIISLTDFKINGLLYRNIIDSESAITLNTTNRSLIIKPPFIYKVFKINDIEILYKLDYDNTTIKYRFSQDYGRSVSTWEFLTKENISTVKINPIRFFQIEYLVEYSGTSSVRIFDINLIGDFQNVTLDSQKTNLYGSREDCNCIALGIIGATGSQLEQTTDGVLSSSTCDPNSLTPLTPDDISKLFKPYEQTQAVNLLNKLSTDANEIFGHEVVYFITDPDKKGIDHTFHEYQLYNYVCSDLVKVSVDGNNFPDNQISMNQFDLSLFDSFEVHIPKDTFKKAFGVEKRPSKEDFLWMCEINRMFQVEHAQQFRNFNNSALYYKVILKKYSQKSNVIGVNQTITDKVKELTKNSTIDELFGIENALDKKDVSAKEQFRPLTHDLLRVDIKAIIDKELIENSTTIISKTNYDLSDVLSTEAAVTYRNLRNYFKVSDNFSFFLWFNIHNYTVNDTYNFINYYDEVNSLGFKINLVSDTINFNFNSNLYSFNIGIDGNADALEEDVWYCYIINVNQRQRNVEQWIYKRDVDDEIDAPSLDSTILRSVYHQKDDMQISEFELEDIAMKIYGSDMKITNIRMFNDVIPVAEHSRLLNQYTIGDDYRYLIFADSANTRLSLPYYPLSQVDTNIIRGEINKENLG